MLNLSSSCISNYIDEVVSLSFPVRVRPEDRLLMILHGYFDESGTHDDSSIVVVGGYLANADMWRRFEDDWASLMDEFKITHFHSSKFFAGRGEFEGWTECHKQTLLGRIIKVIEHWTMASISMAIPRDLYDEHISERANKACFGIYGLALYNCLVLTKRVALKMVADPWIVYAFEAGAPRYKAINQLMGELVNDPVDSLEERIHSFGFHRKEEFGALQAADLIAHQTFVNAPYMLDGTSRRPNQATLRKLECHEHQWAWVHEDTLKWWDKFLQGVANYRDGLL